MIKTSVHRDASQQEISLEDVVPGDIVLLNAGNAIPADCLILVSRDLFVDEATMTGENYPVEKEAALLPSETLLAGRTNCLFMGTHVICHDHQRDLALFFLLTLGPIMIPYIFIAKEVKKVFYQRMNP